VRVRDQATQKPLADATVHMKKSDPSAGRQLRRAITVGAEKATDTIEFGDGRSAQTDAEGWAELSSFEGESVDISARAQGYAPASWRACSFRTARASSRSSA
jgi:hypothetical protein